MAVPESRAVKGCDARRTGQFCVSGALETVLRMIRTGNLAGNTWDYLLFRLSNGRWGMLEQEKERQSKQESMY